MNTDCFCFVCLALQDDTPISDALRIVYQAKKKSVQRGEQSLMEKELLKVSGFVKKKQQKQTNKQTNKQTIVTCMGFEKNTKKTKNKGVIK